jgi:hypothetical protein
MGAEVRDASKKIHIRNFIDPSPKIIITHAKLSGVLADRLSIGLQICFGQVNMKTLIERSLSVPCPRSGMDGENANVFHTQKAPLDWNEPLLLR